MTMIPLLHLRRLELRLSLFPELTELFLIPPMETRELRKVNPFPFPLFVDGPLARPANTAATIEKAFLIPHRVPTSRKALRYDGFYVACIDGVL